MVFRQPQPAGQGGGKAAGLVRSAAVIGAVAGQQLRITPYRDAIVAPEAVQRPARHRFTGIPLALAVVKQTAVRKVSPQAYQQVAGQGTLVVAEGGIVPLGRFHIVDGDEGRFAAEGQAYVARLEVGVDLAAERLDGLPLILGVGLGDARVLVDALDAIVKAEVHLALVGGPGNGGGTDGVRGTGQRDVTLAGEQSRGRIQAEPAGAGDIDLRPGMQVGEVVVGTGGALQRLFIRGQLQQVAGDEARRQAEMAQYLYQQPAGIPARAERLVECLLAGLDAGLHADGVIDITLQALVEVDQEIIDLPPRAVDAVQPALQQRTVLGDLQVGRQLFTQLGRIFEGKFFRIFFHEEIERIDHHDVRDQVHLEGHGAHRLGKYQAGKIIAERILLPVDEMVLRQDPEGVGLDRCAGVGRRSQAHHVRRGRYRAIKAVFSQVIDCNTNCHG